MTKIHLLVEPEELIRINENHGGYLGATCKLCGQSGWLDGKLGYRFGTKGVMGNLLVHAKDCKVGNQAMSRKVRS
jgi:hypothetical protein